MNRTDQIRLEAYSLGVDVVDWNFKDTRIKGLYCDGTIALSSKLTNKEQAAVLAEEAYKVGCRNRYEMAEFLDVPEDTLQEALNYYHHKYGICTILDNYVIYFEPLGVLEIKDL